MSESRAVDVASAGEQRVCTIVGDRLCITCCYNLVGQPIVREGHYNMLIARCPECGTVAALQEHPLLGRWAARWAVVLVGLWLAVLLAAYMITAFSLYGMSHELATYALQPLAARIAEVQHAWMQENVSEDALPLHMRYQYEPQNDFYAYYTAVYDDWWKLQDKAELVREAGGIFGGTDWRAMWRIVNWGWLVLLFGAVWSLLLPHVRRRWLPFAAVALAGLPALYAVLPSMLFSSQAWAHTIGQAIHPLVGTPVQIVVLALLTVLLIVGMLIGRSLARLLVRAFLPPRLRCSLTSLWLIDGLSPPKPGRLIR